ncbi:MAG: hypothetical protein CMJ89_04355 [Planctomycetes bacterium]|nr:hypothetical protein [Planctomycetota bacterium]
MKIRILVSVGFLALFLVLLVRFLGPKEGPSRQAELTPRPDAAETPADEARALDPVEPPSVSSTSESGPSQTRSVVSAESDEKAARTWPEEETRWIDVSLVVPADTPREERVWVLALAANADYEELRDKGGPLVELRAGTDPARIDGTLGAALVDVVGKARIGLPPDADEAWLAVSGSYLYSQKLHRIEVGELTGPVELRPVLGAWISGRLLAPPGEEQTDFTRVEIELTWSALTSLDLGTASSDPLNLKAEADAEGRFELFAVPVGRPQTLKTESPSLAVAISDDVQALPGDHVQIELALLRGGSIRGRVVDDEGGPVAGANVDALGGELLGNPTMRLRKTESDAEGRFVLEGVAPGKDWLRVRHDDYQDLLSSAFELGDGEVREHGEVVLSQGLAIAGTVLFPDGTPATNARVWVEPDLSENLAGSPSDPRAYIGARNDDAVDEEGAFRITGTGPGPWVVGATLQVDEEQEGGPGIGRWTAFQDVVHAPSEELNLVLAAPIHVSGEVVDGAGQPVAAFQIRGERAGSQWYMPPSEKREEAFESEDGSFRMTDLRSGDWDFTAEAEGYARSEEITIQLPSEEPLAFALLRPVRLAGQVVDPDGQPVAGAEVGKELEGTEVFEAMQGRGDWPVAKSDAEGRFALEELAPGAGSVVAKKDGFARSEAVAFELSEGEERVDLMLALRRGAILSGEVYGSDGERSAGCLVIIQMPTLQERRMTNTGSDGTFVEHGLTPGSWQVQAFPGIESLQSESGEALDQATLLAALKMATVQLVDEGDEHVVLGEPPADPVLVHGRVTLADAPVADSIISFVPAGGGGMELLKIHPLDSGGRYELQLGEAGDYLVTIQTMSVPGRQNSIEFRRSIPQTGNFKLDFELPLGRVSGRVLGPDREPLAEARITLNLEGGLVFGTVFGGQYNETVTDANGDYEIPYLRPGRYLVAAGGASLGGFLGDGNVHGRQVTTVEVKESQWVRGLDFRLGESGKFHGTVRDASGALVSGASIFVRDEEGHLVELFSVAQTNASGSFEYPGLAPGDYTITARTSSLASAGEFPVRVRAGESSEVTVVVQTATMLVVNLVDKSGADVPARVSVLDSEGREMNGMLSLAEIMERVSGGLGSAIQRVGPLPPGSYVVRAFAEDGRTTERRITLSGRPERKAKLWLE